MESRVLAEETGKGVGPGVEGREGRKTGREGGWVGSCTVPVEAGQVDAVWVPGPHRLPSAKSLMSFSTGSTLGLRRS